MGAWPAKPLSLSPPVCAAHGWVNSAKDVLRCDSCAVELVASTLPPAWEVENCKLYGTMQFKLQEQTISPLSCSYTEHACPRQAGKTANFRTVQEKGSVTICHPAYRKVVYKSRGLCVQFFDFLVPLLFRCGFIRGWLLCTMSANL